MKFLEFINESSHKKEYKEKKILEIINEKCKDALKSNVTIYRGTSSEESLYVYDTSKTTRKSAHTSNHYTLIFDNLLTKNNYPLRSKSIIASLSYDYVYFYQTGEDVDFVRVLIPYDDAKIGSIEEEDIFDTAIFNGKLKVSDFNSAISAIVSDDNYNSLVKDLTNVLKNPNDYIGKLDSYSKKQFEIIVDAFKDTEINEKNVDSRLKKEFDPDKYFKFVTPKNLGKVKKDSEIWISGKCVAVTLDFYKKYIKKKSK